MGTHPIFVSDFDCLTDFGQKQSFDMGRVRTKTVKKASRRIIEKYYMMLTLDFHTNKRVIEEIAIIPTKRLRNQIAAFVFINIDDANIDFIKNSISKEAGKIDIDVEKLQPGSKFVQNLFFGVSAGLSAIILFFTVTLCCRARREERVQGYVDAIQA